MQQTRPVDAIYRHERSARSDRKTSREEIRIELHVIQYEVEMFAYAGGVVVG
jgi:hypothetical protein